MFFLKNEMFGPFYLRKGNILGFQQILNAQKQKQKRISAFPII